MDFGLTLKQQTLVETAERLAGSFAQRASRYDAELAFPAENFADLRQHNFLALTIPEQYDGIGVGIDNGDPLGLWLVTKSVAKGDSSTGQCLQVHSNTVQLIVGFGTEEQKRRYLSAVVNDGAVFTAYGSEPPMVALGQPAKVTTTVARRVDGGYIINGQKYYATNAGAARYAMLAVMVEGAQDALDGMILPIVKDTTPGLSIEPTWWSQATGMRATVSHLVKFKDVFASDEDLLGNPGDYIRYGIQAKLLPQFASNFVGCAEAAYEFALEYLRSKGKLADPYIQHYVAEMRMTIQSLTLWLHHTAWLWQTEQTQQAQLAAHMYRVVAEDGALKVVQLAIKACSAEDWHYTLRNELDVVFYMVKHVAPVMRDSGGGVIINTASVVALSGTSFGGWLQWTAHSAAAGGILAMTRTLAQELAPHTIRVNSMTLGGVENDAWSAFGKEFVEQHKSRFGRVWNFVCLENEVASPGDFRVVTVAGHSLLYVRRRQCHIRP